jgi:hypothetical protein
VSDARRGKKTQEDARRGGNYECLSAQTNDGNKTKARLDAYDQDGRRPSEKKSMVIVMSGRH